MQRLKMQDKNVWGYRRLVTFSRGDERQLWNRGHHSNFRGITRPLSNLGKFVREIISLVGGQALKFLIRSVPKGFSCTHQKIISHVHFIKFSPKQRKQPILHGHATALAPLFISFGYLRFYYSLICLLPATPRAHLFAQSKWYSRIFPSPSPW